MNLWTSIFVLTLIAALICFFPLLSARFVQTQSTRRDDLNKAFYFERLKELERDEKQGLLENVEQLKTELQKSLLEDIPPQPESAVCSEKNYGKLWFVSGFLALGILSVSAYFVVGSWQAEIMLEKSAEKLPHFYERLKSESTNPLNDAEMQQFATALRVDLQKDPDNAKNWWLLGQIGMNLEQPRMALDSFARANKLEPKNNLYKLAYARILMFSEDETDKLKGDSLLREVIREDHTNVEALSLLAFRYFETEDYKMAAVSWAMMLKLLPKDDRRVPIIERSIRSARDALEAQEQEKHQQLTPQQEK
ncbi:c-type cytochrome biogenesis protein CcmI [Aggregatibacter actinomycetemcomitans]|uniref:c-type cytochrome biogenesis protein CcmI n=1 Tax=Aggregatibacter actinomycetemcomitans TaxID=714 RepID=UPI00023FF74C|nr:c-type cytochrome biogenesis protein CcmI [Aggregatibacter actinomycetemcomitans]EHK91069.1 TPR-repeat-containing protein [Aggregatibacter actinomycetemcomitans RhAA1]KNE78102.1 TPR-repeat-containing protein [Aggregatibacter actinomycetemcomitans RhAA1]MBN6071601.1 c-type cytochrome biogenesis protein CcmI [Aggregatibacter actinomycetemcomitans]MBN6075965.1 c-type cytochrome biogenesis protein CcmI [Aggregatibacter actinomycetemcomitans]MBN6080215.1 c-type cytochrome biogenesis protein CcmI